MDVDIQRLKYIRENAVFPDKDQHYLEVIKNSAQSIENNKIAALYQYEMALFYHELGNTYIPQESEEHRWKQKEALAICETILSKFPNSSASNKCKALKSTILSKSLQLTAERHIPVNQPSRLLVTYRNLDNLQMSAYKISQKEIQQLNALYPEEEKLAFIKKLNSVKNWDAKLINENDYQSHKTEILLPELYNGSYIIVATPYSHLNTTFAYRSIQVTNFALVESKTDTKHNFQLIDRNNGKPISGANLKFSYQQNYERPILHKAFVTDEKGLVALPLPSERWNKVNIQVSNNGEVAYFGDFYVNAKYNPIRSENNYSGFLFTDRSIYRPGQTLYFKGIAILKKNDISSVLSGTVLTVSLMDVHHQKVAQQEFRTNSYGSFSGQFILPNNGLTGNYYLTLDADEININGGSNFFVEEYKRPKFSTSFKPITETYRLNDTIKVEGEANAYAGSPITNAKVSYTVRRVVYYPKWHYGHFPYSNSTPQVIAHGETMTDSKGQYLIKFKAIPD